MRTMFKVIISVLVLTTAGFTVYQLNQEEDLIVGTWIPEGSQGSRSIFNSDRTLIKYINTNELFKEYNWDIITSESPSGLTISYLVLTNTGNSNDIYRYEINALNEELLVLVYQRPNGGIGKLSTYFRQ